MASSSSVVSQTLQTVTNIKIRELDKQRQSYKNRKAQIIEGANNQEDVLERVSYLFKEIREPRERDPLIYSNELNIGRWLEQSKFDPSIPEAKLLDYEEQLRNALDIGERKLDLAHLYSRLLIEWLQAPTTYGAELEDLDQSASDDSFEVVENTQKARLDQLRDKFAKVVFEPLETNEVEIDNYLRQLFHGRYGDLALERLRTAVSGYGSTMDKPSFQMTDQTLKWSIQALLKIDLLNDEKKASLNEFLKEETVLTEIRDVLNMRLRTLSEWNWDLGEEGMPVVPRHSLNGKWRVMMDEDVLQALLSHWIGATWAVKMKSALTDTRRMSSVWKHAAYLPDHEKAKYRYYFGLDEDHTVIPEENLANRRREIYEQDFFMSSLPSKLSDDAGGYYNDDEVDKDSNRKSPQAVKQLLLRTLATEVVVQRSLYGEVAVVQSDFQWFATGVAHTTIFAVLRFLGFQEEWISFFKKALEPPLNMLDGNGVQIRRRGLPMAHVFEKLLGELILFFMDLAVAQHDGMILYRFHDDLWLVGKPEQCAAAWNTMKEFAKVMGLEFNKNKTGSVYITDSKTRDSKISASLPSGPVAIDFLLLDPENGGTWKINDDHVQQHVQQLEKQLNESKSLLQWIKTWNSCIGRFFGYTFGEPANCFGRAHIENILRVHNTMQKELFDKDGSNSTVVDHVKRMIRDRFQVEDIPDSFLFMPESLGGLGLKNPFIPLIQLRRNMCIDPKKRMQQYLKDEQVHYQIGKQDFDSMSDKHKRIQWRKLFMEDKEDDEKPTLSWQEAQQYVPFEEIVKHREIMDRNLRVTYDYLMQQPHPDRVNITDGFNAGKRILGTLGEIPEALQGETLDEQLSWTVHLFEDELFEKFGGLELVDRKLLPVGVLQALQARKVTWQMVL